MRNDLADITLVLDRSGSMAACKEEAENGVNSFVEDQKTKSGECAFTLVQFDTEYEFIHKAIPIKNVPKFTLIPRGCTALFDAIGRAVNETGKRLNDIDEKDRPATIIFIIVTDGYENSSHEFSRDKIKEMITHQKTKYNWQFTYLGAHQNAFLEAQKIGICIGATSNFTTENSVNMFNAVSYNVGIVRDVRHTSGCYIDLSYSDEQRKAMNIQAPPNYLSFVPDQYSTGVIPHNIQ